MCSGSTCVYSTCVCTVQRRMQRSQCCRCNGSGTCAQCSCRKDGRSCTGCLPSRKNRCKNSPPSSQPTRDQAKRAELSQNSTGIRCRTIASVVNVCLELNAGDEDASVDALLEACRLESSHDTPSVTESAVITTADPARTGAKDASTAGLPTSSKEHAWDLLEQHHDAQSTGPRKKPMLLDCLSPAEMTPSITTQNSWQISQGRKVQTCLPPLGVPPFRARLLRLCMMICPLTSRR